MVMPMLSFTMSISGNPIIVDPGTYAYNLEPEMRSLFRGTSSHNTLTINGCDQSKQVVRKCGLKKQSLNCK